MSGFNKQKLISGKELKSYSTSLPKMNELNSLTDGLYERVMAFIKYEEEQISRQVQLKVMNEVLNNDVQFNNLRIM